MIGELPDFYYTAEQLEYALYHPYIVHFAGHNMWSFDGITPVATCVFKKYRKLCDWHDSKRQFGSAGEFVKWSLISVKRSLYGDFKKAKKSQDR